jgi:starvation-inducible DNA-binding protein
MFNGLEILAIGVRGAVTAVMTKNTQTEREHESPEIRTDLARDAVMEISGALRLLLADVFGLYVKTKNFHWHMTGRSFRDLHLLLDEHADQIFAMTDDIAERARKIGGSTIRSISDISRHQRLKDNNEEDVTPRRMLGRRTTYSSRSSYAVRMRFVSATMTWRPPASSRIGLTRPNAGRGFCPRSLAGSDTKNKEAEPMASAKICAIAWPGMPRETPESPQVCMDAPALPLV